MSEAKGNEAAFEPETKTKSWHEQHQHAEKAMRQMENAGMPIVGADDGIISDETDEAEAIHK